MMTTSMLPISQDGKVYRDDDAISSFRNTGQGNNRALQPGGGPKLAEQQAQEGGQQSASDQTFSRRHIVFPDPVAFRYLEQDPCVTVVERRTVLRGYELYLVEQWACSRQSPTLVVVTYTGDERHSVVVGSLSIPADESLWSAKLRVYFKAANQYHARPKETELGEIMVTNLSSFPSALTVIPIPDGDIRKHRHVFIVNEDLKRLGCSGRSGLTLTDPTEATQAKFQQLYKTSDRVPFLQSVTELIKLCQVALYMFEKLDHAYIDGLLCDVTERAISNWWTEVGAEHYNFEPTDGILGPSTVAALLGMLMGAKNRLNWYGAPVSKDVFDIESTKRGISYFQKSQKLERTRRLDRQTLFRLHTATAKAAAGERWGVQKAVKSTMTEIGGKRGEIVMDMVSGKDKGGLADIETLDIDIFVNLAYGERPKWLWYGKPRKAPTEQPNDRDMANILFGKEDASDQPAKRTHSLPVDDELELKRRDDTPGGHFTFPLTPTASSADYTAEREAQRKNVFKSVAGKMSDARSGLGRIKDAVGGGLRGHASRPSASAREDFQDIGISNGPLLSAAHSSAMLSSPAVVSRPTTGTNKSEDQLAAIKRSDPDSLPELPEESRSVHSASFNSKPGKTLAEEVEGTLEQIGAEVRKDALRRASAAVQSAAEEEDLRGPLLAVERKDEPAQLFLSRRHSCNVASLAKKHVVNENRWPRRMSFGDAEQAVLTWEEIIDIADPADDFLDAAAQVEIAGNLSARIDHITYGMKPWVLEKLGVMEMLNKTYARDKDDLQNLYSQLNEACQRVRFSSDEILAEERTQLTEGIKEIEVLVARLEYEINSLVQKVSDVEDGIRNFERQVEDVEKRAEELKAQLETESWVHWFVRTLTGVGTGPNITRSAQ